ncbi:MAG: glycosyltransferase family 4 protein, partial [Rhodospirillales bacterium]
PGILPIEDFAKTRNFAKRCGTVIPSWLEETFAIPPTRTVLVFTGRLSVGKSVMTAARATRQLLDQGADVHFIAAGAGPDQAEIAALLGDRAALPGMVDQDQLGRILASGDLFVFPSQVEVAPNAVLEAKSSGLVPLVAPDGGGRFVASSGYDGLVIDESDPGAWASAVSGLMGNRAQLQSMRAAALKDIRDHRPTWRDVLDEDLMPVWQEAFALSGQR